MQFKLSTVLAVAPLLLAATTYGNPVDNMEARAPVKTVDPPQVDSKTAQWTDLDENWKFTVVHGDGSGGDGRISKRWTKPQDWLNAHWQDSSPALVDKYDSRQACLGVGAKFTGAVVRKNVGDACNAIISKVPGSTIADDGWTILNRMGLADITGGPAYLQFVFAVLNNDVKPTVQLCQSAIEFLLGSECMKKDQSQGGMMAVAESFIVGFNPQVKGEPGL
ncbi:hypothetical protein F4820DRAFT_469900 [Hypoxylon rubiginosum]|uniref:Uncharacterized protein n=1 Tax=Hypoxylon rubiginosum TaxID=110542 RepID=A0ACB9Z1Y1_9PEZI|nr:hypothetical protein F4820DRAFT_469900 [Hypoxylon rubiginosum]